MRWIAKKLEACISYHRKENGKGAYLKLRLPYARESKLLFAAQKLKIFPLCGKDGLDLVDQISGQIAKQSSERRMLPELSDDESEMATNALLATSEVTLEADALRKADAVSLRRFGFSVLLGQAEAHARDLPPAEWLALRRSFAGLVERRVITPKGFFDYSGWIQRVFGLLLFCEDFHAALGFLNRFQNVAKAVQETTTAGEEANRNRFLAAVRYYVNYFTQSALQAMGQNSRNVQRYRRIFDRLRKISNSPSIPQDEEEAASTASLLLISDLSRIPYREFWAANDNTASSGSLDFPEEVIDILRFEEMQAFWKAANLKYPERAAFFPTRPFNLAEISALAPDLLTDETGQKLADALFAVRGVATGGREMPVFKPSGSDNLGRRELMIPADTERRVHIAVANWETSEIEWQSAVRNQPSLTLRRYRRINGLINQLLRERTRIDYVVFPELSIPRRWSWRIARKLSERRISLIGGLEYEQASHPRKDSNGMVPLKNEALLALVTNAPGYNTFLSLYQPKLEASFEERRRLRQMMNAIRSSSARSSIR